MSATSRGENLLTYFFGFVAVPVRGIQCKKSLCEAYAQESQKLRDIVKTGCSLGKWQPAYAEEYA